MIQIILPYPPSTNALWRMGRRRMYKSKRYSDWMVSCFDPLIDFETICHPVSIEMSVGRPDRRKRDLDNITKPILDALETHKVLENDSLVERLLLYWSKEHQNVRVKIMSMGDF